MSRIVITSPAAGYKKGDVIEASAALVAALGSAARRRLRVCWSFPEPRSIGEQACASNSTG